MAKATKSKTVSFEQAEIGATLATNDKLKIELRKYSERAFVVLGETKTLKEDIKALGGAWNANLTCGKGWIFSAKKSLQDVLVALF